MSEIVAYRYRYKDALTWVHSTTEPARHPNLIVEPLCVAGERGQTPLKAALRAYAEASKDQKCPICSGIESCDHPVKERLFAEMEGRS